MSIFKLQGDFIDNLPKIYGFYTGGFVVFIVLMAILEQVGVSADTIGAWESGKRQPRANRLVTIAGVLNVSMAWLLEGREDGFMESPSGEVAAIRLELVRAHALLAEAMEILDRSTAQLDAIEPHD